MTFNIPRLHKIVAVKRASREVKIFKFRSDEIARESEPGQFVMVWNPGVDEIPISVADAGATPSGEGEEAGEVEVAIADVGDCTHSLHQKQVGDLVGLRGPYGRGFALHGHGGSERRSEGRSEGRICVVAGGYGAAPLRFAARRARELGQEVVVLEGARSSADLLYLKEFSELGCEVKVATEDGSRSPGCGYSYKNSYRGLVTELLEEVLASGERFEQVLACGPELMLARVCEIARRERIPTQVSVERIVKCSCGACGSCDLGGYRVCKDGPVFDAVQLEKTEFGRWRRERSGKRVPVHPPAPNELFSIPPPPSSPPLPPPLPPPHFTPEDEPLLKTEVCGIKFPNPLANAAGFGLSGRLLYRYAVAGAGAVVTKSVGLSEREGYPNPTFFELPSSPRGLHNYVNAMGLPNPGIRNYGAEVVEFKTAAAEVPLVLSIFGRSVEECREVAKTAVELSVPPAPAAVEMLEFNASCPHSDFVAVENDPKLLTKIVRAVRAVAEPKGVPLAVKISPNVGDPAGLALTAERAGADAITAVNTVISRPLEPTLEIPFLGNPTGYGGKSGADLTVGGKSVVFALYKELKIPVFAVGGIFSAKDVVEYAKNGASLFQVGSALVSSSGAGGGFGIFSRLKNDLKRFLAAGGYRNIEELVGESHRR